MFIELGFPEWFENLIHVESDRLESRHRILGELMQEWGENDSLLLVVPGPKKRV